MPVQKFRSIEAMNQADPTPDADLGRRIAFVLDLATTLGRPLPRGVFKFRCIEDLNAARDGDGAR